VASSLQSISYRGRVLARPEAVGHMITGPRSRGLGVAVGVAALAAGLFWSQELSLRAARSEQASALEARHIPFLLAGLELPLLRLVDGLDGDASGMLARGTPSRRVVFGLSDTCPFSKALEPALCELVGSDRIADNHQLVIISFKGRQVLSTLAQCARRRQPVPAHFVGAVREPLAFGVLTGILSTPSFLVLDDEWRVIRAYNSGEIEEMVTDLAAPSAPTPTTIRTKGDRR